MNSAELTLRFPSNDTVNVSFDGADSGQIPFTNPITEKDRTDIRWYIETYGSGHSEAILTEDYSAAMRFVDQVDAAAVFVNASTRFTDGSQLGLGAEVGISTQKFHARGPMGLRELTSYKWVIMGNGQVRE